MDTAFYAFPSKPESLKETILEAVNILNKKNYIEILPWTKMNPAGKVVITQIGMQEKRRCIKHFYAVYMDIPSKSF